MSCVLAATAHWSQKTQNVKTIQQWRITASYWEGTVTTVTWLTHVGKAAECVHRMAFQSRALPSFSFSLMSSLKFYAALFSYVLLRVNIIYYFYKTKIHWMKCTSRQANTPVWADWALVIWRMVMSHWRALYNSKALWSGKWKAEMTLVWMHLKVFRRLRLFEKQIPILICNPEKNWFNCAHGSG